MKFGIALIAYCDYKKHRGLAIRKSGFKYLLFGWGVNDNWQVKAIFAHNCFEMSEWMLAFAVNSKWKDMT